MVFLAALRAVARAHHFLLFGFLVFAVQREKAPSHEKVTFGGGLDRKDLSIGRNFYKAPPRLCEKFFEKVKICLGAFAAINNSLDRKEWSRKIDQALRGMFALGS